MKYLFFAIVVVSSCGVVQPTIVSQTEKSRIYEESVEQYAYLETTLPAGVMPRAYDDGKLITCPSSNWVAGFYPGTLIYLYEATRDSQMLAIAKQRLPIMKKEQYNRNTHDLGFMMFNSYGNMHRIQPDSSYKEILLNSANSLASRFNSKVGAIRSWGKPEDQSEFRVIVDNMMNLELLFWAARYSGEERFRNIAVTHANTTIRNHFRPDHSSYHVVVYDPATGAVRSKETHQGYSDSSAWARGQAWGLYGYVLMFRETADTAYLRQAEKIADFIASHPNLPADKIPYWDFNAPDIPNAPRDASSAAIISSALLELKNYTDSDRGQRYRNLAGEMLQSLSSSTYRAAGKTNGGFLIKHCVANLPSNTEIDASLPYADYYYLEALRRL